MRVFATCAKAIGAVSPDGNRVFAYGSERRSSCPSREPRLAASHPPTARASGGGVRAGSVGQGDDGGIAVPASAAVPGSATTVPPSDAAGSVGLRLPRLQAATAAITKSSRTPGRCTPPPPARRYARRGPVARVPNAGASVLNFMPLQPRPAPAGPGSFMITPAVLEIIAVRR